MDKPGRILLWDTETYGMRLAGDSARIIVLAWKWLGEKGVGSVRIDDFKEYKKDPTNDIQLLKTFEEVYKQASTTVAHFGKGFDLPQMNTRRLIHGLQPLPPTKMYDTWYVLKKTFNFKSNSLKNVSAMLKLPVQKMEVPWTVWDKAAAGDKKSMDTIEERCRQDVLGLEQMFVKIRPWMPQYMPNVYEVTEPSEQCKICGSTQMILDGYAYKKTSILKQHRCLSCGAYQEGQRV